MGDICPCAHGGEAHVVASVDPRLPQTDVTVNAETMEIHQIYGGSAVSQ